jgi:hypothetical protein
MERLLTRDEFRKKVFERDNMQCVVCRNQALDAHHLMERRLWDNGGYYLSNGVALCGECHLKAEQTLISPDELREKAGIEIVLLPDHLYPDYRYDKWGSIINPSGTRLKGELFYDESVQKALQAGGVLDKFLPYVKYARTYHLPFSLGKTEDDKTLKDCSQFKGKEIVATIKMDGENTTGYYDSYIHARSTDSENHPSRNWVKNYLSGVLYNLPLGWRICGENLYAKHAIHYKSLSSYFSLFSVWNATNNCLSWAETEEWAALLGLETVPVIYKGVWNRDEILRAFLEYKHKQIHQWRESVEGFVVRLADSFSYGNFRRSVAKYVRENHVIENQHWIRGPMVKNELH